MNTITLPSSFKQQRYEASHSYGTGMVDLSTSSMQAWTMKELLKLADEECKALWDNLELSYANINGNPLLIAEIAKLYDIEPTDVLTTSPQEGVFIAMTCLVPYLQRKHNLEKFHVLATYPGYQGLYEIITSMHHASCDFQGWMPRYGSNGWEFNIEDLRSLIRKDTKLLIVNFPHNPTGYAPNAEDWQQVVDLCKENDIFLFSDEIYYFTNHDGSKPLPSACTQLHNAITLFGLSKTHGLPGLRIGWVCSKNSEVLDAMQKLKDYISQVVPTPSEILALIGLRNNDKIVARTTSILKKNVALWNDFIQKYPDLFEWHPPNAGSTALLKLKGWLLNDVGDGTASVVSKKLAEEGRVFLMPASVQSGFDRDDFVRVSFARVDLSEGLARFEKFIIETRSQKGN